MTIDNVMKLFGLCGNNQPSALVVEMATYRGCAMADVVAERISSLLHK